MAALLTAPLLPAQTTAPQMIVRNASGALLTDSAVLTAATAVPSQELPLSITLQNGGTAELENLAFAVTGPHSTDFRIPQPPASRLAAGGSLTVPLVFSPSAKGPRTAQLRISGNDPSTPAITLHLRGEGTDVVDLHFATPTDIGLESPSLDPQLFRIGTVTLGFEPTRGTTLTAFRRTDGKDWINYPAIGDAEFVTATYEGRAYAFYPSSPSSDTICLKLLLPGEINPRFRRWDFNSVATLPNGREILSSGTRRYSFLPNGRWDPYFRSSANLSGASWGLALHHGNVLFSTDAENGSLMLRYRPDAKQDFDFQPPLFAKNNSPFWETYITCAYELRDGRVLVAGSFSQVQGSPAEGLVLLHPDGSVDTSFTGSHDLGPPSFVSGLSTAIAQQKDGKLLLSGGTSGIRRLHLDGSVDPSFQLTTGSDDGNAFVRTITLQHDGKILIGGGFATVNGTARRGLARLHADGSIDESFTATLHGNPGPWSGHVQCLLHRVDGKILVGGRFEGIAGKDRTGLVLLHPDGAIDPSFGPSFYPSSDPLVSYQTTSCNAVAMRVDGSLILSGDIILPGGYEVLYSSIQIIGEPPVSILRATPGSGVTWSRNRTAGDFMYASFEYRTDSSAAWTPLGDGVRTATGWRLDHPALPVKGEIRAIGRQLSSNSASAVVHELLPFDWTGYTPIEIWRQQTLGARANTGPAANNADPDGDGLPNLIEYGLGLEPQSGDRAPAWTAKDGGHEITFNPPAGLPVTYAAEWSETMDADDWHPAQDLSQGAAKTFRVPQHPAAKLFFRLKFSE